MSTVRFRLEIAGTAQGVGFRPFVHNLAARLRLTGFIFNHGAGVAIEAQGSLSECGAFIAAIEREAPPNAKILSITVTEIPVVGGERGFAILDSADGAERGAPVPPDIAVCPDCLREMTDPADRRFAYPFVNCVNCGPRYTIISGVPYDRASTTMSEFEMCPDCRREYENPADRRFHAQPNACPACGPRVELVEPSGARVEDEPIAAAAEALRAGRVIAVKGIGGWHLACDAANDGAVARLRERKPREDKPLAVMAPDLEFARRLAFIGPAEEAALTSPARPVVVLRRRADAPVSPLVAPGLNTIGVFLPYSPLHHLLLRAAAPLVLTSGNHSGEPIHHVDSAAFAGLSGVADAFLTHNRRIETPCDDSVCAVARGAARTLRRARGFAPAPIVLPLALKRPALAVGAELKSAFCLARGELAFVSRHIGDLDNAATLAAFESAIQRESGFFGITPEIIAHDMHPDYLSTRFAEARPDSAARVAVQHHHAHVAACLAENGERGPAIGVAFDGLGWGPDAVFWGGEFLIVDFSGFQRAARLAPVAMPGGARAITEPWRMAAAMLRAYAPGALDDPGLEFNRRAGGQKIQTILKMIERGVNCPMTTSMGRLFDAVSVLVAYRDRVWYEGQAAVEFEAMCDGQAPHAEPYRFDIAPAAAIVYSRPRFTPMPKSGGLEIDPGPVVRGAIDDLRRGVHAPEIAARFHSAVAAMIAGVCVSVRDASGIETVALSGGVFQNFRLLDEAVDALEKNSFRVLTHSIVPPNDGGLSLGQIVIADAVLSRGAE